MATEPASRLRRVVLIGGDAVTAWQADVDVSSQGHETQNRLVEATHGVRVVAESQTADAGPLPPRKGSFESKRKLRNWLKKYETYDVRVRTPQLLSVVASLVKRAKDKDHPDGQFIGSLGSPDFQGRYGIFADAQNGGLGTAQIHAIPADDWPMPQGAWEGDHQIDMPVLKQVEFRLGVLVSLRAGGVVGGQLGSAKSPLGFLRLACSDDKKAAVAFVGSGATNFDAARQAPHLALDVTDGPAEISGRGPFVRVDLVPGGIELHGKLTSAGVSGASVIVQLMARKDPDSGSLWQLRLLQDTDNAVRDWLRMIQRAFTAQPKRCFDLQPDTTGTAPVGWPLAVVSDKGLALPIKGHLQIDADRTRAQIIGSSAEQGELPTGATISPHNIEVTENPPGQISIALNAGSSSKAARAATRIDWQDGRIHAMKVAPLQDSLDWLLDESTLGRILRETYARAGVQAEEPESAKDCTYGFMPVQQGWLQWPLGAAIDSADVRAVKDTDGVDNALGGGPVEFEVDAAAMHVGRRRLVVERAEESSVTVRIDNGTLHRIEIELSGASGSVSGLLWFAASSPSSADILPALRAGAAALQSPALAFGRAGGPLPQHRYGRLTSGSVDLSAPSLAGFTFGMPSPTPRAFAWQRCDRLPVVTAVSMTRTGAPDGQASGTRALVPYLIAADHEALTLAFDTSAVPALRVGGQPPPRKLALADGVWKEVPLVAITLAGVEFQAADRTPFESFKVRVRHDLPVLDDLFSSTPLPVAKPVDTTEGLPAPAASSEMPTSLEPAALVRAWRRAQRKLALSYTQKKSALTEGGLEWMNWTVPQAVAEGLFEPYTWKAAFSLKPTIQIGKEACAFGSITLDGETWGPAQAAAGLKANFKLVGASLQRVPDGDLKVVGFATALHCELRNGTDGLRDTRGAWTAILPRKAYDTAPFVLRDVHLGLRPSDGVTEANLRATAIKPIAISLAGTEDREMGLWFRDLPFEESATALVFKPGANDAELAAGPVQSAFDAENLPSGLWEWRWCNDARVESPDRPYANYAFQVGAFLFRPLRLVSLRFTRQDAASPWAPASAAIVGSLHPPGTVSEAAEKSPFGPDDADGMGNLVAIALHPRDGQLAFDEGQWLRYQVHQEILPPLRRVAQDTPLVFVFREVRVRLTVDSSAKETTEVRLSLTLAVDQPLQANGQPNFSAARMETRLFGHRLVFSSATVSGPSENAIFSVIFSDPTPLGFNESGVELDAVTLTWPVGGTGQPELRVRGEFRVLASDDAPDPGSPALAYLRAGFDGQGALAWRVGNLRPAGELCVDHARGTLSLAPVTNLPKATLRPIVGLDMHDATLEFRMSAVIAPDTGTARGPMPSTSGHGQLVCRAAQGVRAFRLSLSTLEDEPLAPVPDRPSRVWKSRIEVDFALDLPSCIHWPVSCVPLKVSTPKSPDVSIADLVRRADSSLCSGTLGPYDANTVLRHHLTVKVTGARLAGRALALERNDTLVLDRPWVLRAIGEHRIVNRTDELHWRSVEQVTFVDPRRLVEDAWAALQIPSRDDLVSAGEFSFTARYRSNKVDTTYDAGYEQASVKAGLALRAFAQAGLRGRGMARFLCGGGADGTATVDPKTGSLLPDAFKGDVSWLAFGGSAAVFDVPKMDGVPDSMGIALSMPWLAPLTANYDFGQREVDGNLVDGKLQGFRQSTDAALTWKAPDVDWAAASPSPLPHEPARMLAVDDERAATIERGLKRALELPLDGADAPLYASVEQSYLVPAKEPAPPPTDWPHWFRSLLALSTLWRRHLLAAAPGPAPRVIKAPLTQTLLAAANPRRALRLRLIPLREPAPPEKLAPVQLIALSRTGATWKSLPASQPPSAARENLPSTARLVEHVFSELPDAVAACAIFTNADVAMSDAWWPIALPIEPDPPGSTSIVLDRSKERLFASSSLGWPTRRGTDLVARGSLGIGQDLPFQDNPVADGDPAVPGSGFSGRRAQLTFAAHAAAVGQRIYYAMGRKMIFLRPTDNELRLVSPPVVALSPHWSRVVTPTQRDLDADLQTDSLADRTAALPPIKARHLAPIVPPAIERTTFGLRPGTLQAEFDALIYTVETERNMDDRQGRFGAPGHVGPVAMRQLRAPRGVPLPRIPASDPARVLSHGRRTFVWTDDLAADGLSLVPFRLFDGVATVFRHAVATDNVPLARSHRLRLSEHELGIDWAGKLTLQIESPGPAGDLQQALWQMGLLRSLAPNTPVKPGLLPSVTLTIGAAAWAFHEALWLVETSLDKRDKVTLQVRFAPDQVGQMLGAVRAAIDGARGDTLANLLLRCATGRDDAVPAAGSCPSPGRWFALAPETLPGSTALAPEPRRTFALPMTMRAPRGATLSVSCSTLVFGDPSYDRELSGTAVSDVQRAADGMPFKLALDREEYGSDTPLYFAAGRLDRDGAFEKPAGSASAKLRLQRQPALSPGRRGAPLPAPQKLFVEGMVATPLQADPWHEIVPGQLFCVTIDQLRVADEHGGTVAAAFAEGDQIVFSVEIAGLARSLIVRAKVVPRPIIPPAPSTYSLVVPESPTNARVCLHATAPMPQHVEHENLLQDLAKGHVRRRGMFEWREWRVAGTDPVEKATLVKVDRSGGAQVPERIEDIQSSN